MAKLLTPKKPRRLLNPCRRSFGKSRLSWMILVRHCEKRSRPSAKPTHDLRKLRRRKANVVASLRRSNRLLSRNPYPIFGRLLPEGRNDIKQFSTNSQSAVKSPHYRLSHKELYFYMCL